MKKILHTTAPCLAALVLLWASAAIAQNDDSFRNGKPFAELSAEIEANTAEISTIEAEEETLSQVITGIRTEIAALAAEADSNAAAIATLTGQLDALEASAAARLGELGALAAELDVLKGDALTNAAAIEQTEAELAEINRQFHEAFQQLISKLEALNAELKAHESALQLKEQETAARALVVQGKVLDLKARLAQLTTELEAAETLVDQSVLNTQRITALEELAQAEDALAELQTELASLRRSFELHRHQYYDHYTVTKYYWHEHVSYYPHVHEDCSFFGVFCDSNTHWHRRSYWHQHFYQQIYSRSAVMSTP